MSDFGHAEFCHDIGWFEVSPALRQVDPAAAEFRRYRALIGQKLVTIERKLQEQEQCLVEVL